MWQNAVTDGSVERLWPGSQLQHYVLPSAVESGIQGGQYFVWTILFLIVFGLVFRRPFSVFFTWMGGFFKSPVRRTYFDTSPAVRYGLLLSFVITLPISAFLVYGTQAVEAPYYVILGCICAYFALRFIVTSGISYVSGEDGFVTAVNRMSCVSFMTAVMVFCVIYILGMFMPDLFPVLTDKVAPAVSGVLVFLYLTEQLRIIFAFKEPLLMSILYLCTLEILPIAIAVATILKKISNILVSQPAPGNTQSPFSEITSKYGVQVDYFPFFKIEPLTAKEFRAQKVAILDYTAIFFSAKSSIDAFFSVCEAMRVTVPETMKYFCTTENIALYLQKHIVYRKRKIFFGKGTVDSVIDTIGPKHKGENFLIASTDTTKPDVIKAFTKAGLKFGNAVFSKTVYSDLKDVDLSKYQMVVFYSPSDVKSLAQNYPDFKQGDLLFVTYGPSTARALKENGFAVEVEAPTPEAPSVSKALLLYLENHK